MSNKITWHVVNKNEQICGHKHRTPQAAEKCMNKLMNWSKDKKTCSEQWYNSKVVPTFEGYYINRSYHEGYYNK